MKWSTEFTLVSDFILIVLEMTLHLYGLIKGQKGSIFQLYSTVFFRDIDAHVLFTLTFLIALNTAPVIEWERDNEKMTK